MLTLSSSEAQDRLGELLEATQQETIAITRNGHTAAFLISSQHMEQLLDARLRRGTSVVEFNRWSREALMVCDSAAAALTEEQIDRMVHESR